MTQLNRGRGLFDIASFGRVSLDLQRIDLRNYCKPKWVSLSATRIEIGSRVSVVVMTTAPGMGSMHIARGRERCPLKVTTINIG